MFSLLRWGLHFVTRIFNCLMTTFWRPVLLMWKRFVADTLWHCCILPPKRRICLFCTRHGFFLMIIFCIKFFYRRLTCIEFHGLMTCHPGWVASDTHASVISSHHWQTISRLSWKLKPLCIKYVLMPMQNLGAHSANERTVRDFFPYFT